MIFYETTRVFIMMALAFTVALFLTPFVYHFLIKLDLRKKNIRDAASAPIFFKFHQQKNQTPTMAGVIIWGTVLILALGFFIFQKFIDGFFNYFNFVNRAETYLPLAAMGIGGLFGLIDDVLGVLKIGPHGGGLDIRFKLILYTIMAALVAGWFYFRLNWNVLYIPFVGNVFLGWWSIPLFMFILIGTAFSANETDGLDGLAGGVLLFSFVALLIIAFVLHRYDLAVMTAALLGALLAFLWFNVYPAKFFMGDTGSMSLGITLGLMAILTNTVFFLPFFAFVLVLESMSVIIQLVSKKLFKKKVFLSTPIHHHFEGLGWPEPQVTMRFWILNALVSMVGLVLFFLSRVI